MGVSIFRRGFTAIFCLMILLPAAAGAAVCSPIPASVKYYGKLTDVRKFGVTLVASSTTSAAVQGRLYVAPRYEDVAVVGEVVDADELVLRDLSTGHIVLRGSFLDRFESMHDLKYDALAVTLENEASGAMRLSNSRFGPLPDRDAINAVMLDVHDAAMTGDISRFAKHVRFPIIVTFIDRKPYRRQVIRDASQFVRMGKKLVGPNLTRGLVADVPHDPFCCDDDCMLAGGFL